MYGRRSKLFTVQILIYLILFFTDKVYGKKAEQYDVAMYGGRVNVNIFYRYVYLANVYFLDFREQSGVSVKL